MKRDNNNEFEEFLKVLNKTINEKNKNIYGSTFNESNSQYKDPIPVLKKQFVNMGNRHS